MSAAEQDFLNLVTLPVYKMASVYTAQQGANAGNAMAGYADIIALDLLYAWINRSVTMVEDGARNMVGVNEDQLNQWRRSVDQLRQNVGAKQNLVATKTSALEAMIARTQEAEQVLTARIGTRIGDAIAFSASQAPN